MPALNTKTEDTTPSSDDILYAINDPAGTPSDRKVTAGNLITKAHGLSDGYPKVTTGTMATQDAATLKSDLSLDNVDNTSDASKPISTATQTALDLKSDTTHTHTESDITDLGDYATSAELTTGLATKSDTTHNHDAAYAALSHTHDDGAITAAASATNYTPTAATVEGHLSGIDTALASAGGGGSTPRYTYSYLPITTPTVAGRPGVGTAAGSPTTFLSNGYGLIIRLDTNATCGYELYMQQSRTSGAAFDRNPSLWHTGAMESHSASNTWVFYFVFGGRVGSGNTTLQPTSKHIGFYFMNNNGTAELYATNANGATQTTTSIGSGLGLTDVHDFYADMTSGTDVKFYVDGILKATHTTNLPSGDVDFRDLAYLFKRSSGTTAGEGVRLVQSGFSYDAY